MHLNSRILPVSWFGIFIIGNRHKNCIHGYFYVMVFIANNFSHEMENQKCIYIHMTYCLCIDQYYENGFSEETKILFKVSFCGVLNTIEFK